jgi:plasmid stabilization system protein ParE
MAENRLFTVRFTKRADTDAITIKNYLLCNFTQREVAHFHQLLEKFEKVIVIFPDLYTLTSNNKNIRRAVLSKQLSVFYRISKSHVTVNAILDNRMNPSKWP